MPSTYHKSPILLHKYLSYLKYHRIDSVFKIFVWTSVLNLLNLLHGSKVTISRVIEENSGVFLNTL